MVGLYASKPGSFWALASLIKRQTGPVKVSPELPRSLGKNPGGRILRLRKIPCVPANLWRYLLILRKCHRAKEKYQVRGLLAQRSKLVKTSDTVCQFRTVSEFAQSADSAQVVGTP